MLNSKIFYVLRNCHTSELILYASHRFLEFCESPVELEVTSMSCNLLKTSIFYFRCSMYPIFPIARKNSEETLSECIHKQIFIVSYELQEQN